MEINHQDLYRMTGYSFLSRLNVVVDNSVAESWFSRPSAEM